MPDFCQTMSSLEQVLKAYEGPDQFFLHNINAVSCLSSWRNLCTIIRGPGGARRSRTDDILLAKQALYQLSYGPIPTGTLRSPGELVGTRRRLKVQPGLVGPGRLELPTSRLSGVRSNQAELRAYGRTTALSSRTGSGTGSRSHTSIDRPNTGRSKREIGKRNEDGGDPHLCMALSRFR